MLKFGFGLFLSPWKFVQRGNGIRTVGATEFATGGAPWWQVVTKVFGFCFLTILPSPATCVSQYPRGTHPLTHQVPFLHFKAVFPDSHTVTIQEG